MNYFRGNKLTGCFSFFDRDNTLRTFSPDKVWDDPTVVWKNDPEAGDFFWPHVEINPGQLVAMDYEDE